MPFSKKRSGSTHYDVFNGDADGICALHQLRLYNPIPDAKLITGVKRDIKLLEKIADVSNCSITVLDISMDSNKEPLLNILSSSSNRVVYIDHHFAGELPQSENLTCHIDPSPELCTSILVDRILDGRYRSWAICGAFGDNLEKAALALATKINLSESDIQSLREIGEILNYNGYGAQVQDLYFPPDYLFTVVSDYDDPFEFYRSSQIMKTLRRGFESDMELALSQPVFASCGKNRVYRFPENPWARRVSGVFANLKARENPDSAHAMITENKDGTLRISVRAPVNDRRDADTLCRAFPTGGGRAAAAGINALPVDLLDSFLQEFENVYS